MRRNLVRERMPTGMNHERPSNTAYVGLFVTTALLIELNKEVETMDEISIDTSGLQVKDIEESLHEGLADQHAS
jgi:hypothetical protein